MSKTQEPVQRRAPVPPMDCKHQSRIFVKSSHWASTGTEATSGRSAVTLCRDCGEIRVFVNKDGVTHEERILLPTAEMVEAAGQWKRYLDIPDETTS